MKILYVLVSSPGDIYLEQAALSVHSLRRHNPGIKVTLLTDRLSRDAFGGRGVKGEDFISLFDEVIVKELDASLSGMQRSRLLKTGMRNYVDGDFLYVDTDTLFCRQLPENEPEVDFGACLDIHVPLSVHSHRDAILSLCRRIGFDASGVEEYFNSGVMLVRDNEQNRRFFSLWQQNYLEGCKAGVYSDQPSLAKTDAAFQGCISRLPDEWNCQAMSGVRYLGGSIVFHYLCTCASDKSNGYLYRLHDRAELRRLGSEGLAPFEDLLEDPLKGFAPDTLILTGEDLHFLRTRRYRWMRGRFRRGGFSLPEFLLKVRDHLFPRRK